MRRIPYVLMLLVLALPAVAAKYHKWVDQNGVTHYSATPPKGQETTEVRANSKPASDPAAETEPAEGAESTAAAAPAATTDPVACESARGNLETLRTNSTILREDPATKTQVKLSPEEVEAAWNQAEQEVAKYCEQATG